MKITKVKINNFRALESIDVQLDQFSVILGENDVGKSSFLYALEKFFDQKKLTDNKDWYKSKTENPIEITLSFTNLPEQIDKKFVQDDNSMVIEGKFTINENPKYTAILANGDNLEVPKNVIKDFFSSDLFVFIPVKRDITNQLSMAKTALLGRMIRTKMNKAIKEATDARQSIEQIEKILRDSIQEPAKQIQSFLQNQLNNEAIKLSFNQLHISPIEGVSITVQLSDDKVDDINIENRGAGTQNSVIIALIRYIATSDIKENFIFCLEEPENSLHPKAQRQLLSVLQDISQSTQVLVTTHSPVFIDRSKYENNILFSRNNSGNTVAKTFDKNSPHIVREDMGIRASDALLKGGGNCAVLVEGKTEEEGFPIFMEMMGLSEFQLGISIINMSGSDKHRVEVIINLLKSYEIPCVVVLDKDAESTKNDLERMMKNNNLNNLKKIFCLKKGNIEDYYPPEIALEVINQYLNPNHPVCIKDINTSLKGKENIDQYKKLLHDHRAGAIEYLKIKLGGAGTKMMKDRKMPVPDELQEIIKEVRSIATEN